MTKIKACVFNAYGTLLDTFLPFEEYSEQLGDKALVIYKLWRGKRLQYSSQLSLMNRYTSYETIRKYALDFACDVHGVRDENVKKNILDAHAKLKCYDDTKNALATLKSNGITTTVLSNGAPQALSSAVKHAGIDDSLDRIFSTEQVRAYKPSPAVYEYVEEQLGIPRSKICFFSSNSWDIAGAVSYGFRSVWVNRFGRTAERLPYKADMEITSLEDILSTL